MTLPEDDLLRIGATSEEDLAAWLSRTFPRGVSAQWWIGVFEGFENRLSPLRSMPDSGRSDVLKTAARLPILAARRGEILETHAAYWLLRFAADVIRLGAASAPIPSELTPDAAIRWALDHMPWALDEARSVYPLRPAEDASPSRVRATQETERVVIALKWVVEAVTDEDLGSRARAWITMVGDR